MEAARDSKHILVVEDDQAINDMLQMALELEGYRVTSVRLGNQALDMLISAALSQEQGAQIDLILLDLQLPDMEGTEIVSPFQELVQRVPLVIVISARPRAEVEQAAAGLRAASFLHKPFTVPELLARINEVFSTRAVANE